MLTSTLFNTRSTTTSLHSVMQLVSKPPVPTLVLLPKTQLSRTTWSVSYKVKRQTQSTMDTPTCHSYWAIHTPQTFSICTTLSQHPLITQSPTTESSQDGTSVAWWRSNRNKVINTHPSKRTTAHPTDTGVKNLMNWRTTSILSKRESQLAKLFTLTLRQEPLLPTLLQ